MISTDFSLTKGVNLVFGEFLTDPFRLILSDIAS